MNQIPSRYLINLTNCNYELLAEASPLEHKLDTLLQGVGFIRCRNPKTPLASDVYDCKSYQFDPEGATELILYEGGHISIHTWPEKNKAAIDIVGVKNYPVFLAGLKQVLPGTYLLSPFPQEDVGREVVGRLNQVKYAGALESGKSLLKLLRDTAKGANFHIVEEISGESINTIDAAVVLSESHFSAHYNRATRNMEVDIFTCGEEGNPLVGFDLLVKTLEPKEKSREFFYR